MSLYRKALFASRRLCSRYQFHGECNTASTLDFAIINKGRCQGSLQKFLFSTSTTPIRSEAENVGDPTNANSTDIVIVVENGVRKISFNRPEKKNALTPNMFKMVMTSLREANEDDSTVVVAITGVGDYFTSGMDMTPRPKPVKDADPTPTTTDKKRKPGEGVLKFLSCFVECKKPLIALVNGPAVGAGVTVLGLCDAVYASDTATFHTSFTKFGVPPEMASTYTFPRIMGYAKASNLLIFNQKMNAQEAFNHKLVSRIFPHETFAQECATLLESYGQLPVKSLIYSKELVRGRWKDRIYNVSEKEQSYFDPEMAKKVIMQFMASQKMKKQKPEGL